MSIKEMIGAAYEGNAANFEKHFHAEVQSRLGAALAGRKAAVVAGMFGLSEAEKEEEEKDTSSEDENEDNTSDEEEGE